jgi:hypothetical protein
MRWEKQDHFNANPSSYTSAVNFAQINPHTKWSIGGQRINAKPLCPTGEPLPQLNHHRWFVS